MAKIFIFSCIFFLVSCADRSSVERSPRGTGISGTSTVQSSGAVGNTYYVDWLNGDDLNPGTSKLAPLKRHPYMSGFAGKYTHLTGDQFIFKGGVTWPATAFPLNIVAGGGPSGNSDYYGVDTSWFNGPSWTKPAFDMEFQNPPPGGGRPVEIAADFVTLDNLEIRNLFISASNTFNSSLIHIAYGVSKDVLITNCLVHDWQTNSVVDDQMGGITVTGGDAMVDHTVVYNSPNQKTWGACTFNISHVQYSVLHDCSEGVYGGSEIHDNLIYNIGPSHDPDYHENALATNSGIVNIYNNVVHDCNHGTCIYPNPNWGNDPGPNITTIYNNVVFNSVISNIAIDLYGYTQSSVNVYNNTLECGTGTCVRVVPRPGAALLTNLSSRNNHYIGDGNTLECWNNAGGNPTCGQVANLLADSNNVTMSLSAANSLGYSLANNYAPAYGNVPTVAAGMNLVNLGIAFLDFDILGISRPSSGVWNAGAYQFNGTSPSPRPTPTAMPLPTPSPTPASGGIQTVTFNDLTNVNSSLDGQYPVGVIDWGTGSWYLAAPWGKFTSNSVSFNGGGTTSASFTFVQPRTLAGLDLYNGGAVPSEVTIKCESETKTATVQINQLLRISTGFTSLCSKVTLSSSNGWDTNFDNLVLK